MFDSYNEITGNIIIPAKNKMTGKVDIIAVGDNDIICSISVNNISEINSHIYIYSDTVIEDISYPPRFGNQRRANLFIKYRNDIAGSLFISPQNKMTGIVEIVPPPRKKLELYPTKDAFIRSSTPTFNYGSDQIMYVGYNQDLDEIYRSLIEFDISELPQNTIIEKAELKIYNNKEELKAHQVGVYEIKEPWTELGVTWLNQPNFSSIVDIKDVGKAIGYEIFDVKEVVNKWYVNQSENNGLIIKAINESVKQYEQFNTKENVLNKPILEITYYDTTIYSFGRSEIPSGLFVFAVGNKDIIGKLNIREYDKSAELPSRLHVYNPDYMESFLTINRPNIISDIIVRRTESDIIVGSIVIRQKRGSEVISNLIISVPDRIGRIYVPYRYDLNANLIIRKSESRSIWSNIIISSPYRIGNIYIFYRNDINSNIVIRENEWNQLESEITISRPNILGNIEIYNTYDVLGNIRIKRSKSDDIQSFIAISRNSLISNIKLTVHSSINGYIIVRQKDDSGISANINIPYRNDLNSWLEVIGASMISGNLYVLSGYLKANLKIPEYATYDKIGKMVVRVRWASEIPSTLFVGGDNIEGGYVFIL